MRLQDHRFRMDQVPNRGWELYKQSLKESLVSVGEHLFPGETVEEYLAGKPLVKRELLKRVDAAEKQLVK